MPKKKEITVEIYTNTLYPGMILKGDCYDGDGRPMIDASKPVTAEEIARIKSLGVKTIYYRTSKMFTKNDVSETIISDQSVGKAISVLKDIESQVFNHKSVSSNRELHEAVSNFIRDIKENPDAYLNLLDIFDLDEYTYSHAINVSTMSIMIGTALKFDEEKLYRVGLAGLLLDIGKSMIPKEVLFKKGPLTQDELQMIRNHPIYGYNLLKGESGLHKETLDGVLLHHEHFAGGGYPFGFTHDKLSYAPQILAIADTFDAATTNRPYRGPMTFVEIFSFIMQNAGKKFNPVYSNIFLTFLVKKLQDKPLFFEGAYVLLNTGEIAYVHANTGDPYSLRPIVNIIFNPRREEKVLKYHLQINLEKDPERMIVKRIDDMASVEKLVRVECKGDIECIYQKQEGLKENAQ